MHRLQPLIPAALLIGLLVGCGEPPAAPRPLAIVPPAPDAVPTGSTELAGPDGVAYPDWRYAGVPGGIPDLPAVVQVAAHGGAPDDSRDDADAIERALDAAAAAGGGAAVLAPGTWHLDRPIAFRHDGTVLRGSGRGTTRLEIRFGGFAPGSVRLLGAGGAIGPQSVVEGVADPEGMVAMALQVDGREVARRGEDTGAHGEFWITATGEQILAALGPAAAGEHVLTATARWKAGSGKADAASAPVAIRLEPGLAAPATGARCSAAISISGSMDATAWPLAHDARRGDLAIDLAADPAGLAAGDVVQITAEPTARWRREVRSQVTLTSARRDWQAVVTAVEGRRVHLNHPLRDGLLVADAPSVHAVRPRRGCGIEAMTIAQPAKLYLNTVYLRHAWGCWLRDLSVERPGRNPFTMSMSSNCEVRDLDCRDPWFSDGGGTGYVAIERSWDCLVDGVVATRMRHAPNLQWSASGNVMRRIAGDGCDVQWHAGTTLENLIEDCTVRSEFGRGGKTYGYGAYASGPDADRHGPHGPRNVLWGNDLVSSMDAVHLRGGPSASGWIVAYNRLRVTGHGPALYLQLGLSDLLFLGNVCASADPSGLRNFHKPAAGSYNAERAAVWFNAGDTAGRSAGYEDLSCTGIRIRGNRFHGFAALAAGAGAPAEDTGNQLLPPDPDPPRPAPPVPSIWAWQRSAHPLPPGLVPLHPQARRPVQPAAPTTLPSGR